MNTRNCVSRRSILRVNSLPRFMNFNHFSWCHTQYLFIYVKFIPSEWAAHKRGTRTHTRASCQIIPLTVKHCSFLWRFKRRNGARSRETIKQNHVGDASNHSELREYLLSRCLSSNGPHELRGTLHAMNLCELLKSRGIRGFLVKINCQ